MPITDIFHISVSRGSMQITDIIHISVSRGSMQITDMVHIIAVMFIWILFFVLSEYASSSDSEPESKLVEQAWRGDRDSDVESVDSEQDDPLK